MNTRLSLILLIAFLSPQARADLLSTYQEVVAFRQTLANLPEGVGLALTQQWISRLEAEIAGASHQDPPMPFAGECKYELADLYLMLNKPCIAAELFEDIGKDVSADPTRRLMALDRVTVTAFDCAGDEDTLFNSADRFLALIAEFQDRGIAYAEYFDRRAFGLPLVIAGGFDVLARKENDQRLKARYLLEAAQRREQYARQYRDAELAALYGSDEEYVSALNHAVDNYTELGDLQRRRGAKVESVRAYLASIEILESLRRSHPNPADWENWMHHIGAMIVRNLAYVTPSVDDYVERARALLDTMPPGFEALQFLEAFGNELSSADRNEEANAVFELAIEYSERWFPDDHQTHHYYQLAMISSAQNMNRLGLLDQASQRLEKIRELPLELEMFQRWAGNAERVNAQKRAKLAKKKSRQLSQPPPPEPLEPPPVPVEPDLELDPVPDAIDEEQPAPSPRAAVSLPESSPAPAPAPDQPLPLSTNIESDMERANGLFSGPVLSLAIVPVGLALLGLLWLKRPAK